MLKAIIIMFVLGWLVVTATHIHALIWIIFIVIAAITIGANIGFSIEEGRFDTTFFLGSLAFLFVMYIFANILQNIVNFFTG